jgi:hypothetical protein
VNVNSKKFQALQAKWDKKLKESGFEDAEQRDGNLKWWSLDRHAFVKDRDAAKEEYYRLAGHFLYDYKFPTEEERRVWELHSEGKPIMTIVSILKKQGISTHKNRVHGIIKALAKLMVDTWKQTVNG